MNNKFSLLQRLLVIIVLLNILGGCALVHETKGGGSENMETFHTYSYRDLQKMDEITIDSENVFLFCRKIRPSLIAGIMSWRGREYVLAEIMLLMSLV